ncbi:MULTISPECIES: hypothetical protein [Vibrio]|nr:MULTISPECIES: hypothetical protein [Vibrio]
MEVTLGKLIHAFNTLLRINRLKRGSETLNLTLNLMPDLQVMANDELLL